MTAASTPRRNHGAIYGWLRAIWMLLWLVPLVVACAVVAAWWLADEWLDRKQDAGPYPNKRERKESSLAA